MKNIQEHWMGYEIFYFVHYAESSQFIAGVLNCRKKIWQTIVD